MKIFYTLFGIVITLFLEMVIIENIGDVLLEPNLLNKLWYGDFRSFYNYTVLGIILLFSFMGIIHIYYSAKEDAKREFKKSLNNEEYTDN